MLGVGAVGVTSPEHGQILVIDNLAEAAQQVIVVIAGVVFLGEPISLVKVAGVALVVAGVVTLNLTGAH
ncbi:EmrE [Mycobacteroides abscessus subsp. abscessus]|nr:EmrE [Mycobacteroides abscessus subsp. abscessus]